MDKKHGLVIPYRDGRGILRKYEPDFIIKTLEKMYLAETKARKDMESSLTKLKAKASINWCKSASKIQVPSSINQQNEWEYLIVPEDIFRNNIGLSFSALIPYCRVDTP